MRVTTLCSKAFRNWYGLSPRAFRDRSINISSFAFTFAKLGPFRPTYLSGSPLVRTIQPQQFSYVNSLKNLVGVVKNSEFVGPVEKTSIQVRKAQPKTEIPIEIF
jgi:hypothetical protein